MDKVVVEVGLLLNEDVDFYDAIIKKAGGVNQFNCETHDLYWTNKKFDELAQMTENQIKMACVRLRTSNGFGGNCFSGDFFPHMSFDNVNIFDKKLEDRFKCNENQKNKFIKKLEESGWYLILDTFKVDYQYSIGDMKSRIQLQEIDNIGLVLYYDNPDYYNYELQVQRDSLIEELNSYGFNFDKREQGIDKIRTLLFGYPCFSDNQNG